MFSRNQDNKGAYPQVPDSLRSDSVEMNPYNKAIQPRADTAPSITPYLGLRARLSQMWLNPLTILPVIVLIGIMLLVGELDEKVDDAKAKALSACTKVEDVGSAMASMPHYLSLGVNDMTASGIESAISAMVTTLELILTGVEALIVFYINSLVDTYTCLIVALVHGSLEAVASVAEDATDAFNKVVDGAASSIESISKGIEDTLKKITSGIEDSLFGDLLPSLPDIDFSDPIKKLKDFDLDADDFAKDVRKLNDDLPNFDEVKNLTKEAVSIPFDFVRKALNESYSNYKFDRDVFPLAQKEQMTFCSENDALNGFFDGISKLVEKAQKVFIAVLVILAVAFIALMVWSEIKRWRREQQHARLIEQMRYDAMDLVYISSRPMTSGIGIKLASRFKGKSQILVRWCWAYATTPRALFVLWLAMAGFFFCLCQVILLNTIKAKVPELSAEVGGFADEVVAKISDVSDSWAQDANGVIKGLNDDINNDLLGYVANATDAVNDTLTVFMDSMNEDLETVFNGTILIDPIKAVLHCVIGEKVENVQDGLTWVHDHAKISLPLLPNDTFSMGASESVSGDNDLTTFLASPSSVTTDEVSGAINKVVEWLQKKINHFAIVSTGLLLVYVIVVLIGVARMLAGMAMRDKGRAEGGTRYHTGDDGIVPDTAAQRTGFDHYGYETRVDRGATDTQGAVTVEKPAAIPRKVIPRENPFDDYTAPPSY